MREGRAAGDGGRDPRVSRRFIIAAAAACLLGGALAAPTPALAARPASCDPGTTSATLELVVGESVECEAPSGANVAFGGWTTTGSLAGMSTGPTTVQLGQERGRGAPADDRGQHG
jgi:hypothetical protein